MSNPYDWSRFVKKVPLNSSKEIVYRAFATPEGLCSWFLRSAIFNNANHQLHGNEMIQTGDKYIWMWHGWPDEVTEKGEILEANGVDRIRFIFGSAGIVTVSLIYEQEILLVELTQENIPTDENGKTTYHLGCMSGWIFYLANLKSVLEGGKDLRNKNADLKDVITS